MHNLLEGVRVVETASYMMGPIAGRILADWGAEVIKIEPDVAHPPFDGDRIRGTGLARGIMNGDLGIYYFVNGNKKSVAIDTTCKQGQIIQQKLCASADIVIHHLNHADQKKLGIDYATLSKMNPGIIVASTSGYGIKGPDKDRPGFDAVAYAARSGMLTSCAPDGAPFIPFMGYGDVPSGSYFASAIMAAYIHKLKTGEGNDVSVSLYGSAIWTAGLPIISAPYGDPYPTPLDAGLPSARMFRCGDGKWLYMMCNDWDRSIVKFKMVMPSFPEDAEKRWPNYFAAKADSKGIAEIFAAEFASHDRDDWVEKLTAAKIPFDIIADFADIQKDAQAWEGGHLIHPKEAGTEAYPYETGIPVAPGQFKNGGTPEVSVSNVGEHTREQLKLIGYTDEQVDKFRAKKILTEGDQYEPDRFNVMKPGTYYNKLFSAMR